MRAWKCSESLSPVSPRFSPIDVTPGVGAIEAVCDAPFRLTRTVPALKSQSSSTRAHCPATGVPRSVVLSTDSAVLPEVLVQREPTAPEDLQLEGVIVRRRNHVEPEEREVASPGRRREQHVHLEAAAHGPRLHAEELGEECSSLDGGRRLSSRQVDLERRGGGERGRDESKRGRDRRRAAVPPRAERAVVEAVAEGRVADEGRVGLRGRVRRRVDGRGGVLRAGFARRGAVGEPRRADEERTPRTGRDRSDEERAERT